MAGIREQRLAELGYTLPPLFPQVGNYARSVLSGNLLYLSGQVPRPATEERLTGKVGTDITLEQAYAQARIVGLQLIAVMRDALGDLDRVKRIVQVHGMVNAAPDFTQFPQVINGCSDLFVQVFGEAGIHARSAFGVGGLPDHAPVEIEAIVEII